MEEPWFTYYKGRGRRQMVPRTAQGWSLTVAFVVAVSAPGIIVAVTQQLWILWVMIPWMLMSLLVFLRVAMSHAEVVPIDEAVELWRAQRERGKRRP